MITLKTYKEMCDMTALRLGCDEANLESVWHELQRYAVALTATSFVRQVAHAMQRSGQQPNMSAIKMAASYL